MRAPITTNEHLVDRDELFFTMTDRTGVITGASAAFVDLSVCSRADVLGVSHAIVRHPEMPRGVFALIWERLLAGRPAVAYVMNRAKDGTSYWVLAAITPIADGFLSVCGAPACPDLWDAASDLYARVLPIEAQARAEGHSASASARIGAAELLRGLAALGFATYGEFIRAVLPAEVVARSAVTSVARTTRPEVIGPFGALLDATRGLGLELSGLLARLDEYLALGDSLRDDSEASRGMLADLSAATAFATRASEVVADRAPVLTTAARTTSVHAENLRSRLGTLARGLDDLNGSLMELRFRIALACLHNDMATAFGVEVADGRAPAEALDHVTMLCAVLESGAAAVTASLAGTSGGLQAVAERVHEAEKELAEFQHLLATWRNLVTRYQMSAQIGRLLVPIDAQLHAGRRQMAELRAVARRCLEEAEPSDVDRLRLPIARVLEVGADLALSRAGT